MHNCIFVCFDGAFGNGVGVGGHCIVLGGRVCCIYLFVVKGEEVKMRLMQSMAQTRYIK
jgi:hypothetical protein